jgi:hypothetical protein
MDFAAVQRLLLRPGEFFRHEMEQEPRLVRPALIVLLIGILGAVGAASSAGATAALMPAEVGDISLLLAVIGGIVGLIGSFVLWLVWAVVLHLVSMVFGGRGTFVRTMEFVGLGMVPQLIGSLITMPLFIIYYSGVRLQPVSDPMLIEQAALELVRAPMMQFITIIGLLFMVWTANLWIFGLQQTRELPSRKAVLTVAIPVGLYVAYNLFNLMG